MADYTACQMSGALNTLSRTVASMAPKIRYAMQGVNGGGDIETWVAIGAPDLREDTHTGAVVLGSWYDGT